MPFEPKLICAPDWDDQELNEVIHIIGAGQVESHSQNPKQVDATADMDLLTDDEFDAGLPSDLAQLAVQLQGQAAGLKAAYPASGNADFASSIDKDAQPAPAKDGEMPIGALPVELQVGNASVDSAHHWLAGGWLRRGAQVAAAVLVVLGLSVMERQPSKNGIKHLPTAVTTQVQESPGSQREAVHATIFLELSGAEQEGLLDLLGDGASMGSI